MYITVGVHRTLPCATQCDMCITRVWCLQVTLDEADALLRELETHSDVEAMDTWSNGDTTEQDKDMSTDSAKVEPQQSTDGLDEIDK